MTDENWIKWCRIRDKYDPDGMHVGVSANDKRQISLLRSVFERRHGDEQACVGAVK